MFLPSALITVVHYEHGSESWSAKFSSGSGSTKNKTKNESGSVTLLTPVKKGAAVCNTSKGLQTENMYQEETGSLNNH
jgi:hypothetical protein